MGAFEAKRETASEHVQRAFLDACLLDVLALKPGNVGVHGAGHGMQALDFLHSGRAAAAAIGAEKASVGERIHAAIAATHAAIGVNTNLGIVLLVAPLAHAALQVHTRLTRPGTAGEPRASPGRAQRGGRSTHLRGHPPGQSRWAG